MRSRFLPQEFAVALPHEFQMLAVNFCMVFFGGKCIQMSDSCVFIVHFFLNNLSSCGFFFNSHNHAEI